MTASRGQGRRGVRNKKKNGRHPEPPGCAVALQSCRDAAAALTRRGRRAEPASARRHRQKTMNGEIKPSRSSQVTGHGSN